MKPGRQFVVLSAIAIAGAVFVRPGDLLPAAARFIAPLFAQQTPPPETETALPSYVPGSHSLLSGEAPASAATPQAAPPATAEPVAAELPAAPGGMGDTLPHYSAALSAESIPLGGDGGEPDAAPKRPSVVTQIEPIVPPGGGPSIGGQAPPLPAPVIPAKELFGAAKKASPLAARAIGSYSRGCLAGAVALPVDGPAWQAMRLSRNRNWGHPKLVSLVEQLATESQKIDGWPGLLVGDIAQPRGGPMLTGHASHQIGLDADVWLTPMPNRRLTNKEREDISATSMLDSTDIAVDPKIFNEGHVKLIKRAASYPQVERVLVHPAIKKALCNAAGTDRKWLGKVRPIGGHYYHFHIRMGCPPGFAGCVPQKAPTGEDGCTKEVDDWLVRLTPPKTPPPPRPPGYKPPPPKPPLVMAQLPQECTAVLESGPDGIAVPPQAKVNIKVTVRTPAALRPHLKKFKSAVAKQ